MRIGQYSKPHTLYGHPLPKILHLVLADVVDRDRKHDDLGAYQEMFERHLADRLAAKVHEDASLMLDVVASLMVFS